MINLIEAPRVLVPANPKRDRTKTPDSGSPTSLAESSSVEITRSAAERNIAIIGSPNVGKSVFGARIASYPADRSGTLSLDEASLVFFRSLTKKYFEQGLPIPATGLSMPRDIFGVLLSSGHRFPIHFQDHAGALNTIEDIPAHSAPRDALRQFMLGADAILFFLDISQINQPYAFSERIRELQMAISLILTKDGEMERISRPIAIVATKWDHINPDLPVSPTDDDIARETAAVRQRLMEIPSGAQLLNMMESVGDRFTIIPISALGPDSDEGVPSKKSQPFNLLAPFHWAVRHADEAEFERSAAIAKSSVNDSWAWFGLDRAANLLKGVREKRRIAGTHPLADAYQGLEAQYRGQASRLKWRTACGAAVTSLALMVSGLAIDDVTAYSRYRQLLQRESTTLGEANDRKDQLVARRNPVGRTLGWSAWATAQFEEFRQRQREHQKAEWMKYVDENRTPEFARHALERLNGLVATFPELNPEFQSHRDRLSIDATRWEGDVQVSNALDRLDQVLNSDVATIQAGIDGLELALKQYDQTKHRQRAETTLAQARLQQRRRRFDEELKGLLVPISSGSPTLSVCKSIVERIQQLQAAYPEVEFKPKLEEGLHRATDRRDDTLITEIENRVNGSRSPQERQQIDSELRREIEQVGSSHKRRAEQLRAQNVALFVRDKFALADTLARSKSAENYDQARSRILECQDIALDVDSLTKVRSQVEIYEKERDQLLLTKVQARMTDNDPDFKGIDHELTKLCERSGFRMTLDATKSKQQNRKNWDRHFWLTAVRRSRNGVDRASLEATDNAMRDYLLSDCPDKDPARVRMAEKWRDWFSSLSREMTLEVRVVSAQIGKGASIASFGYQRPRVELMIDSASEAAIHLGGGGDYDTPIEINKTLQFTVQNPLNANVVATLSPQRVLGPEDRASTAPFFITVLNATVIVKCRNGILNKVTFECPQLVPPTVKE